MRVVMVGLVVLGLAALVLLADVAEHMMKGEGSYADRWRARMNDPVATLTAGIIAEEPVLPKAFLPKAPMGWTRRDWTPADGQVLPGAIGVEEERLMVQRFTTMGGQVGRMAQSDEDALEATRLANVWIYEWGDKLVEFSALPIAPQATGLTDAPGVEAVAANMRRTEQRKADIVVQGVPWSEISAWSITMTSGPQEAQIPVRLTTTLGDVALYLRATDISPKEVMTFLEGVDYDGLNATLAEPVPGIGSAAADAPEAAQEQAQELLAAQNATQEKNADKAMQAADRQIGLLSGGGSLFGSPEPKKVEVKINRMGGQKEKGSGCGAGTFCKVEPKQ